MRRLNGRPTIAVVGGGVAGAVTAMQLACTATAPNVVLLDRGGAFARGVAYSTRSRAHLLNVPASRMGVFADDPEHFWRWAQVRLGATVAADAFLPRGLYGDYVAETLGAWCSRAGVGAIDLVHRTVVDVEADSSVRLRCHDGSSLTADFAVMALGNAGPAHPAVPGMAPLCASRRYIANPWTPQALGGIPSEDDVLLIGTGLTMYDVALALHDRGHRGTIHALSRRGLLPQAHAPHPSTTRPGPPPAHWLAVEPTLAALLRAVRAACEAYGDWRCVIESLRPVTAELWQRLPATERRRFLTHVRPFWDVHRHRAPLAVQRRIERLVARGALRCHRRRIRAWRSEPNGVTAEFDGSQLHVGHVVNCTGPDTDVQRSSDPLVHALLRRGLIVRDRYGLGVETALDGALVDADGRASASLFTVGTWRRAAVWESVAVPELRVQAAALARRLTQSGPADGLRLAG